MSGGLSGQVRIVDDVPDAYAELVIERLRVPRATTFGLATSAGGSGAASQRALGGHRDVAFEQIELFYVDERCVAADSPDRNANVISEAFGDRYQRFAAVHEMDCDLGPQSYEALLEAHGPLQLVQLGFGPDGHVASLFPSSAGLEVSDRLVIESDDPLGNNHYPRLTLTYKAIEQAECVTICLMGEDKIEALQAVLDGKDLPAARVRSKDLIWLIDARVAAGAALS